MVIKFNELYHGDINRQQARFAELTKGFESEFSSKPELFFSAPGRTELGGNHTDHNHGRVLAAAVNLDIIAAVKPSKDGKIHLKSAEYKGANIVNINDIEKRPKETGTSLALIKGICYRCKVLGYNIGGFEAFTMTNVLKGSGLSSSAAFEVLVVTILSHLYNDSKIDPVEVAKISQFSENVYFGKPSGLMDQMASSVGGVTSIDFDDPTAPIIKSLNFDLEKHGYALCITDTGGSHAKLTDEYAAITKEMKEVSHYFGKEFLRDVSREEFESSIAKLREKVGDRAVLRAMHFFDDDEIAAAEAKALQEDNIDEFLELIKSSGTSSATRLQNVFSVKSVKEQGISLGVALSNMILSKSGKAKGATRVHGGGFAGTMQAFVPLEMKEEYIEKMEAVFGKGSCYVLSFRDAGGTKIEL